MRPFAQPAGLLLVLGALGACGSGPGGQTSAIPTKVAFQVQPGTIIEHTQFNPVVKVELQDINGDLVNTASNNVRLHLKAGGGNGALTGIVNRPALSGVVTFTALGIDQAGSYTMVAVSDGLDSAQSAPFTVDPTPPPPNSIEIQVGTQQGGNQYRSVKNQSVNPAVDTLAVAGSVTWTWLGGSHGVQSTGAPTFVSSAASSVVGNEYTLQFNTAGTYSYNCSVHGNAMTGRIEVQ